VAGRKRLRRRARGIEVIPDPGHRSGAQHVGAACDLVLLEALVAPADEVLVAIGQRPEIAGDDDVDIDPKDALAQDCGLAGKIPKGESSSSENAGLAGSGFRIAPASELFRSAARVPRRRP
jgi:hypothetical protein